MKWARCSPTDSEGMSNNSVYNFSVTQNLMISEMIANAFLLKRSENQDDFLKSLFFDLQKFVTSKKSSETSSFNFEIKKVKKNPFFRFSILKISWFRSSKLIF